MSKCNENIPLWRVLVILMACCLMYFYLYTNVFDGIKTSGVYRVVEGDLQAVWKDKFGSISYYLKLMKEDPEKIKFEISASNTSKPTQQQANVIPNQVGVATTPATEATTTAMLKSTLKEKIISNESIPLLTLFTSWNDNSDKYLVHNLTVRNWLSLSPFVIPVIFTNESDVADECRRMGWEVFPVRVAAADGIPVLKYMFQDVMEAFNTTFYAYSNGDILYTDGLIDTLVALVNSHIDIQTPVMLVGKRTNVDNVTESEGSSYENLTAIAKSRGKLFTGYAEDYFITPRVYPWKDIAEVVIGRRAYDNWLVYYARKQKQVVIDATSTLLAVHQTTVAGNFEGHGHKNGEYNHNLLVKMYKRIKYGAGLVDCAERHTKYEKDWSIVIFSRAVPKHCSI